MLIIFRLFTQTQLDHEIFPTFFLCKRPKFPLETTQIMLFFYEKNIKIYTHFFICKF